MVQLIAVVIELNVPMLACVVQHGESEMNDIGRIGGDSDLSAHGLEVCFGCLIVDGRTEYKYVKQVNLLGTDVARALVREFER